MTALMIGFQKKGRVINCRYKQETADVNFDYILHRRDRICPVCAEYKILGSCDILSIAMSHMYIKKLVGMEQDGNFFLEEIIYFMLNF